MPKRKLHRVTRSLTPLQIMNFNIGASLGLSERERRVLYFEHRERLLRMGNEAPLHCEVMWEFEPNLPDALRPSADDDVMRPEDGDSWGPAVQREMALQEARRQWLAVNRGRLVEGGL